MKILIKILVAYGFVHMAFVIYRTYNVVSNLTLKFFDFKDIDYIVNNNKKVLLKLHNEKKGGFKVKKLTLQIFKDNIKMGAFNPLDLVIDEGENDVYLEFAEGTKYGKIAIDLVATNLKGYKMEMRGLYLGFIPFTYNYDLSDLINFKNK